MKKIMQFLSYVLVAAVASCATLCINAQYFVPETHNSKLEELSKLIEERFIGEVDVTAMEDAAAYAMVDALGDRWSYYIPADQYQSYQDQMNNSYVGVGITVSLREDNTGFDIREVVENGPAAEAGIRAGDILIQVNGESVDGLDNNTLANAVKGEEGTTVDLTFLRNGEVLTFTVERRTIRTIVAKGQMLPDQIGLVTIENFDKRCAEEAIAAIDDLIAQGAKALVFDVRNNPGGYVTELVKVLDYLLPEGELFNSVYYDGREYKESSGPDHIDLPMAVLVNGESYSAAEFFATAIREYEAGFVVGTQTSGKGYFQTAIPLRDGSAVGLSVGKYFTPKGVSLAETGGLTPDVVVEVDDETFIAIYAGTLAPQDDPQLLAALERILKD